MKTDIVLKLLEAGYTKADIDLMEDMKPAEPEKPAAPEQPAEPAAPEQPAEPEKPADPEQNSNEQLTQLLEVVGKLQKTVDALQKSNAEKAESKIPEKIMNTKQVLTDFFGEKKKQEST